jgi:GTP cyclohydrolase I
MANNGKHHKNGRERLLEMAEHIATQEFEALDARPAVEDAVRLILLSVGEDPTRDGLLKTPHRVAKMYEEMLEGYKKHRHYQRRDV